MGKTWLRVVWLVGGLSITLHGQKIIEPPFGLQWGDTPEKLISWSSKHSLDVTIFIPGDQPASRVIKTNGRSGNLPGSNATGVEGRFLNGGLYEVTIHHSDSSIGVNRMEERFEKVRREIILEYGELRPNQQRRVVEDGFVTRTQSFHLEQIKGVFLLIAWTEVEDLFRKSKEARFSLIYRNDNFKVELSKKK